jgi:signal peptidase I
MRSSGPFRTNMRRTGIVLAVGSALAVAEDIRRSQTMPEPEPQRVVPLLPLPEPVREAEPERAPEPPPAPELDAPEPDAPGRSALRRALRILKWTLELAVLAAWLWWALPQGLGGRADWVMVSGWSMEPRYHTGDLVLVDRQSHYHVGQVIAYRVPKGEVGAGAVVIHRIVAGNGTKGFTMKGDNRTAADLWYPKTSDVIGAKTLRIPHAFAVIRWVRSPLVLGGVAALVVFLKLAFFSKPKQEDA